jgi:CheY-like chemotaxis protein
MTKTVLLVEDNAEDVYAFRWTLKKANLSEVPLQLAEHGQKAIDYLSGAGVYSDRTLHPLPDLVLLDLKMPYKGGLQVLEWIRQQLQFDELPVVILSGSDEERDHVKAEGLGARGYMVKPLSREDLAGLYASVGLV